MIENKILSTQQYEIPNFITSAMAEFFEKNQELQITKTTPSQFQTDIKRALAENHETAQAALDHAFAISSNPYLSETTNTFMAGFDLGSTKKTFINYFEFAGDLILNASKTSDSYLKLDGFNTPLEILIIASESKHQTWGVLATTLQALKKNQESNPAPINLSIIIIDGTEEEFVKLSS